MATDDDTRVKDLLDDATRAELERWFGLPSFQDAGEPDASAVSDDDEWAEARKKRSEALAAVDPELLDWHRRRIERDDVAQRKAVIALAVERPVAMFDPEQLARHAAIAEPRDVPIPYQLEEDLRVCTPQALLRDLHRAELYFDKAFEIVDVIAEDRVDGAAAVRAAMTQRPGEVARAALPLAESRALVHEGRQIRRTSWPELFAERPLPNRYITEAPATDSEKAER
jgi:hypothetical protein